jgi:hypothetical protein
MGSKTALLGLNGEQLGIGGIDTAETDCIFCTNEI